MIRILIFAVLFLCGAAYVAHRHGWWPAIRLHPWQALFIGVFAFTACVVGGTKGGNNDVPPVVQSPPVIMRFYRASDGRMYPIDALLKEAYRD